jgi:phosphate starvation-inducible PhoH-like protein
VLIYGYRRSWTGDLPRRTISGLKEALLVLKDEGIGIIYPDDKDIVRHRLVKR